jgi:hypothetical protein
VIGVRLFQRGSNAIVGRRVFIGRHIFCCTFGQEEPLFPDLHLYLSTDILYLHESDAAGKPRDFIEKIRQGAYISPLPSSRAITPQNFPRIKQSLFTTHN